MHAHVDTVSLVALLGLGAYHGLNPGMGWLFAVALGMQDNSRRAIGRTLLALALGHALAVGAALAVVATLGVVVPVAVLRWLTAALLVGFGIYKLMSNRHPRWGGMRIGFRDLIFWSFLMASAHGAGLMLLPVVMSGTSGVSGMAGASGMSGATATLVHTAAYLAVTGLIAVVVYEKLGVGFLRRGWLNVDLIWAAALVGAGIATVVI